MHDLRAAVYRHLQRLSLAFFTQTRTGEVQSRIANDIGGVQTVVTSTATSIVSNVTTVLAATAAMFLLDWRLAVAALGLLPFFVWLTRRVGEERRRITAVRQDRLADMSSLVEESLSVSGILLGKTMGRAPELAERFEGESAALADLEVRSRMAGRWRMASVQMSFAAMPALIYLFAGLTIANGGGAITIGTLVAFTTLQTRLFFPVQSLLSVGVDVQSSLALFERVFHYLDLPVEIEEREGAVTLAPDRVTGAVSFEDVGIQVRARRPVDAARHRPRGSARDDARARRRDRLGKDDPRLPAGAAVRRRRGPRGDRRRRRARHDARLPCRRSWASSPRRPTSSTPRSRTTCASRSRALPMPSWRQAARAAQIHDLIDRLPDGYETVVGERGYRFSGGEKQRIAIARTVLRDPPILVLDEATSALDTETERAVQAALDELARGRTTVAIAHRLSTVRDAEQIAVLDRGRLVELGDHDELMAAGGRYAAMVAVQGGDLTPA